MTQIESAHSASIWLFLHHCMVEVPQRGSLKDFSGPVTFITVSQYKNKINSKNARRASYSPSLRDLYKIKSKEKKIPFHLIIDLNMTCMPHSADFILQKTFGVTLVWTGDSFRPSVPSS